MRPPMNRIDAPTLLTIIYVLVDDWYQEQGYRLTPMLPGPEPSFRDSEMLTFWFIPRTLPQQNPYCSSFKATIS
jgi:hypothetical protein